MNTKPRGIAFTGGEAPGPETCAAILRDAGPGTLVAAADSGLETAERSGARPDWITGDMDSLSRVEILEKYPPGRIFRHPREKDFTDTELALEKLREAGAGECWIIGGGGGRTDHLLAVVSLFGRPVPPARWFTAREEIRFLDAGEDVFFPLRGAAGPVSVFPLGTGPWEVRSRFLRWPLDSLAWERGNFSISNEVDTAFSGGQTAGGPGRGFGLEVRRGRFLVLCPLPVYS